VVRVRIVEGPGSGQNYEIEEAVILGRLPTNDIPVEDAKASREHAKIYRQGGRFAIVDLNSSNGTTVNGKPITKQVLEHGDVIAIGLVAMEFEDPEEEARKDAATPQRKSLDDAFDSASKDGGAATAGAGGAGTPEIVMGSHKPLQFNRVKAGRPLLGFDLEQMSPTARLVISISLVLLFAGLIYASYMLAAG
jgi:pSer/pThr/pTyr-binding forkhead associated (FHA) protein